MNEISRKLNADDLILQALREDIPGEDVSTNAVMPEACPGTVDLIAKEDGVIAGLDIYARVFTLLDEKTEITFFCKDGDEIRKGQKLAVLRGDIRVLLSGERVALNYLQRMSGIATYTREMASLLEGTGITLLDTRKTSPNNRIFEKYAVRVGGRRQSQNRPLRRRAAEGQPYRSGGRCGSGGKDGPGLCAFRAKD